MILNIGNLNPMRSAWKHWKPLDPNTYVGNMVLNKDFKEFIELLNSNNVHYMVVGGYASLELSKEDFMTPGYVIQLGNPPNRIDILTRVTGLEFEECYPSKAKLKVERIDINFIDMENLRKNKQALGRYQDLADLENLK